MKFFKHSNTIPLYCLAILALALPYLVYQNPTEIQISNPIPPTSNSSSVIAENPEPLTDAQMLQEFVELLRHENVEEIKDWSIKGGLINDYSPTDVDALIGVESIDTPVSTPEKILSKKQMCTQRCTPLKKS
jgi:hypothetical protein